MNLAPRTAHLSTAASRCFAAALLIVMVLLAGGAARRESITVDEVAHTGAGVSYLQKLDMRMNEEHPPLSKVIAAIPLVLRRAHADYSGNAWTFSGAGPFNQYLGEWVFGHGFLFSWNDPRTTIFWARIPMLLVALLLGVVLYTYAVRLGGTWAGILCLAAFVTTPAFLAFGPLVITDIVITLFWVLAVWQLPNMWHSPTRLQVVQFGLAFGGALLAKFSSGLLLFVFLAVALSLRWKPVPGQPENKSLARKWRRRAWWNILKGTAWAALFVYVVYFVLSWNQPTSSFNMIPGFPASALLRRILMPLWIYFQGLAGFAFSALSRPTYILGHSYPHGVWFYFPVIFALKSQLAFLLMLLLAISAAAVAKLKSTGAQQPTFVSKGFELHWRCIWVSLVVYVAACLVNRLDISIRHFTIAIALTILLLAPLPRMLQALRGVHSRFAVGGAIFAVGLVVAMLVSAVRAYPNFFPYINSLGMGRPGYMLVNDSNLDWDQSFPAVENFITQHGLTQVLLDRYGFSDTSAYIPQGRQWNCQKATSADAGQWAVVSANNLGDTRNCFWLMQYPHQPIAGGSLYAVLLPKTIPAAGQPGGPPLPKDFHVLGIPAIQLDARDIFFDVISHPDQLETVFKRFQEAGEELRKAEKR